MRTRWTGTADADARRVSRPLSTLSFTLLAVGLTMLLSTYLYLRPSPHEFVSANRDALAALPVYPGARSLQERSWPISDGDNALARVVGYTTTRTFVLPRSVSSLTVSGWYLEQLRGRCRVRQVLGEPAADFTCGTVVVSVNPGGPLFTRRYEITVDSR
jgi:hypothetical protein